MKFLYDYFRTLLFMLILLNTVPALHISLSYRSLAHAESSIPDTTTFSIMDAVSEALRQSPDIHLQGQEILFSEGVLQQTRGGFDTNLNMESSYSDHNVAASTDYEEQITSYSVGFDKKFRTGLTVDTTLKLTQDRQEVQQRYSTSNVGNVSFTVAIPLLRGRGTAVTTAQERAAETNLAIAYLQSKQTASQTVKATATAYWQYRTALEGLKHHHEAVKRAEKSMQMTEAMIKADQAPASLLESAKAKLSSKKSSRILSQQALYEAKQNLGVVMGLDFDKIEALPYPSDSLPEGRPGQIGISSQNTGQMISTALENRWDHKVINHHIEYNKILLQEARNNLLPQLNLNLSAGYSGWDSGANAEKFFNSLCDNIPGASASFNFEFLMPVQNNSAKGSLIQRRSMIRQYEIRLAQSKRSISAAVSTQRFTLRQKLEQLKAVSDSIAYYKNSVKSMEKKFKLGMATLFDLLSLKDDLDNAILQKIEAQQQYANTLLELGYQTGTLVTFDGKEGHVEMENLIFNRPSLMKNNELEIN